MYVHRCLQTSNVNADLWRSRNQVVLYVAVLVLKSQMFIEKQAPSFLKKNLSFLTFCKAGQASILEYSVQAFSQTILKNGFYGIFQK